MRHLLLTILALAGIASAAVSKNLPGAVAAAGNDRPVIQSFADSLVGVGDTGFVACGPGVQYCVTTAFNSIRYPLQNSGMPKASSVVSANPDSIVCDFMLLRKDADTSDINLGININIGTTASPLWSLYGASVVAGGTNVALTKYRVAAPFAVGRQFRPWVTTLTATDTVRTRFVECGAK